MGELNRKKEMGTIHCSCQTGGENFNCCRGSQKKVVITEGIKFHIDHDKNTKKVNISVSSGSDISSRSYTCASGRAEIKFGSANGGPERHLYVVEWNHGNVEVTLTKNYESPLPDKPVNLYTYYPEKVKTKNNTYVHTELSQRVPYYQPMTTVADMVDANGSMTNFKKEPSYSGMYPKVIGNGNPEEIGYAGFVFGGILIVAVFVKAIQKFGRIMQSSGEKTKKS